jgi:hypothetical protein
MDFGDWTDQSQIAAGIWRNNPRGRRDLQNVYGETGGVLYSVDLTPFNNSSSSSGDVNIVDAMSYAARMDVSSNAVFVGLVVACLCVSFVLVFSVVAAVKVSSSSSSGGEGGGHEEEEEEEGERERLVGRGKKSGRMRRKKTKKKRSDESSSSLYGAIV